MACRFATTRRFADDERGAAFMELAVILPVIAILGLGVIEFANLFYSYQLIQNGVRDAARFVSGMPYDPTNTALKTQAKNIAVYGNPSPSNNSILRLPWWDASEVSVNYSTVNNASLSGGLQSYRYSGNVPVVTVSARVRYGQFGFLGFLGLPGITLEISHQERVIGVR